MTPAPFSAWEEDRDSDSDSDVDEVEYMLETYFMQVLPILRVLLCRIHSPGFLLQIDNTYNKLQTLMEYIDDTEDYINLELDSHRNTIIQVAVQFRQQSRNTHVCAMLGRLAHVSQQFDLLMTAGTAAASVVSAVGGIFGMNLSNNPDGEIDGTWTRFIVVRGCSGACDLGTHARCAQQVVVVTSSVAIIMFAAVIGWCVLCGMSHAGPHTVLLLQAAVQAADWVLRPVPIISRMHSQFCNIMFLSRCVPRVGVPCRAAAAPRGGARSCRKKFAAAQRQLARASQVRINASCVEQPLHQFVLGFAAGRRP